MKNTVVVLMNDKVIVNEWYPTAEDAHKRFVELMEVNSAGKREDDRIVVCRMVDNHPMAYIEL